VEKPHAAVGTSIAAGWFVAGILNPTPVLGSFGSERACFNEEKRVDRVSGEAKTWGFSNREGVCHINLAVNQSILALPMLLVTVEITLGPLNACI